MDNITLFCKEVLNAYNAEQGDRFADLFQLTSQNGGVNMLRQEIINRDKAQIRPKVDNVLDSTSISLSNFVTAYLTYLQHVDDPESGAKFDAFATFYESVSPSFTKLFQLRLVKTLSLELIQRGLAIDKLEQRKGRNRKVQRTAELLKRMCSSMLSDRSPFEESKRQGILFINNLTCKAAFKLGDILSCGTNFANIEQCADLKDFPLPERITHSYYRGRCFLFQNDLPRAERQLDFAFRHCPDVCMKNKKQILVYLIPTRILLGKMPTPLLLERYNLAEPFVDLIHYIRTGNLAGFLDHLNKYVEFFYHTKTLVLLKERGTTLVWRCLFLRLYKIHLEREQKPKLSYDECLAALRWSAMDNSYDLSDVESILVSLISQKYVRGYLHHDKRLLVAGKPAFPRLTQVAVTSERYDEDTTLGMFRQIPEWNQAMGSENTEDDQDMYLMQ